MVSISLPCHSALMICGEAEHYGRGTAEMLHRVMKERKGEEREGEKRRRQVGGGEERVRIWD